MACGMPFLRWLSESGFLPRKGRLLDIGESCLMGATKDDIRVMLERHGGKVPAEELPALLELYAKRSVTIGDSSCPTLFLSELLELTEVEYISLDVVTVRKAYNFDLNIHDLAPDKANTIDICLNFGTTEHLVNQYNAFKVMHEAVKPGGYMFHQVPSTGYTNHGYFCYNPLMFKELGEANGYELAALWYFGQNGLNEVPVNPQIYPGARPGPEQALNEDGSWNFMVPNSVLNVLFRKIHDAPFRVGLELKTAATASGAPTVFDNEYITPAQRNPTPIARRRSLLQRVIGRLKRMAS